MRRILNLLLIVLVAVCALSLWWARGKPVPGWLEAGGSDRVSEPDLPIEAELSAVHLKILNGTDEAGLASDIALLVPRLGCVVQGVGNARQWAAAPTILINRRLPVGQARELASRLGGIPVQREWDERSDEDAVLVLGNDHARVRETLSRIGR